MTIFGERVVASDTIDGQPNQFRPVFLKLRQDLVGERHLVSTDRAPVGWIKRQDDPASGEFAQRERLVRRDVKREVGCLRALGENVGHDNLR